MIPPFCAWILSMYYKFVAFCCCWDVQEPGGSYEFPSVFGDCLHNIFVVLLLLLSC